MQNLELYAPYIVIIIQVLVSLKIFARTDELTQLKADLIQYMNEQFVQKEIYADNHKALQDSMLQISHDISDLKTLIIGIGKNGFSNN